MDRATENIVDRFASDLLTVPTPSTISDYRQSVQQFLSWATERYPNFTPGTAPAKAQVLAYHEYLNEKRYSPHTIRKHLAAVRHFTAYLVREDLKRPDVEPPDDDVTTADVPRPPVPPPTAPRPLEPEPRAVAPQDVATRAEVEVEALRSKLEKREQYAQQLENLLRVQAVPPVPHRDLRRHELRSQDIKQILAQIEMIALQEGIATVSTQKLLNVPGLNHEWLQTIAFIGNVARGVLKPWDETTYFEFLYALRLCRYLQQRGISLIDVILYHERRSRGPAEGAS